MRIFTSMLACQCSAFMETMTILWSCMNSMDYLYTVDILSACNLVNYFGKMVFGGSGVGQITLYPILMRKGSTAVALYGLGNIRDERLNRMFQTPHAVQWMRPEAQEGCQVSDWFNIQPDCLDDLAWAIMHEISKLSYRVSEADVTHARNQRSRINKKMKIAECNSEF